MVDLPGTSPDLIYTVPSSIREHIDLMTLSTTFQNY